MVAHLPDPDLDHVLRALADRTRRDIVRRTLTGEASVSALAADYDMSFAAVQKHVAVLEAAGLVTKVPAGRERIVRAVPDRIARARGCLEQLEALWRHRLGALDDVLSKPQE
jgi:DNA-binding transcriptional ArsR family regulator